MSPDDIKQRIVNEIKARAYDDKYVDRGEEREIVQIAIQLGVTVEGALAALGQVCDASGYVLESRLVEQIRDRVGTAAGTDGLVGRAEFDLIFAAVKGAVRGTKNDREVKKLIVTVMEESGTHRIKRGWFSNWYAALKHDLGM